MMRVLVPTIFALLLIAGCSGSSSKATDDEIVNDTETADTDISDDQTDPTDQSGLSDAEGSDLPEPSDDTTDIIVTDYTDIDATITDDAVVDDTESPDNTIDDTTDIQSDDLIDTEQPDTIDVLPDMTVDEDTPLPDVDTNECTNNDTRTLTDVCGLNGNGDQPQICTGGSWTDNGFCVDPDECLIDATQDIACGYNDNGTQPQLCVLGTWTDNGACVDPDVCENETWQALEGIVSECVLGQWIVRRVTKQWGSGNGNSVCLDSSGNIYVAGHTNWSLDGNTSAGDYDVFFTKWNADGTKAWTKQWGTSATEYGFSVAVDSIGNVFVTGYTGGALDGNTNAGSWDAFLTKWSADGTKTWTKQWGSSSSDYGYSVAVDESGNIYVAGSTEGGLDGNASTGGEDIFLTKWNADGTKAWTKQWGTSAADKGLSVKVDVLGTIFVTGYTAGALDGNTSAGNQDIFLTKWNAEGTKAWTKQWGTSSVDRGNSVELEASGIIYVAGWTYGALDGNTKAGDYDIFFTKWNADGTKAWTRQWGTSSDDRGYSVAVDTSGNIFITGDTYGSLDGNTSVGSGDIFLAKWSTDGVKAWTKQWGTTEWDQGNSVAVNTSGTIYVTGYTYGSLDGNTSSGGDDILLTIMEQ